MFGLKRTLTNKISMSLAALLLAAQPLVGGLTTSALADPGTFRIIFRTAQHFGDDPNAFGGAFNYNGEDAEFVFDTPGALTSWRSVLMLQTKGVDFSGNILKINGVVLDDELLTHAGDTNSETFTQMIIVQANVLRATSPNTLEIIARNENGDAGGNLDDFVIKRAVIQYLLP